MKKRKLTVEEKRHHSRRLSIKEGIAWSFRAAFGDSFIAPFAIASGMASFLVVILNSLYNLGTTAQLLGSKLEEKFSRKKIITTFVSLETIGWLSMSIIAYLYLKNIISSEILPFFILIDFGLILFLGNISHPSWFSLMGDLTDSQYRGRWFSKRSTITTFTMVILAITASLILEKLKSLGDIKLTIGFICFFFIAFLGRFFSIGLLKKHYDPEEKKKKKKNNKYPFKQFLKEIGKTNFGKFTLFRGIFALIMAITAPLTSIYLLRELQLNYLPYILIMFSGSIISIILLNLWGKLADKFGNYRVIALTTILIPLYPISLTISTNIIYLFFVPAIIGGVTWSAFFMAAGNFIYDNVQKEKREKAISYYNLFIGIGALTGGLIGAILIKTMPLIEIPILNITLKPIFSIFILGTLLRMIVVGFFIPKLKEIKNKEKIKGINQLEHLVLKEIKPTLVEDFNEITSIPKYLKEK